MTAQRHKERSRTKGEDQSLRAMAEKNRAAIVEIARRHGAHNIRIFGSVVRGEDSLSSDLDLLVEFEDGRSLLDRIALMQDLEDALGVEIDVVTEGALHPLVRPEILAQAQPL